MRYQTKSNFPDDFLWGASTSAYQVEGAAFEDGKSPSIIDMYEHPKDTADFQIASDHYHRYQEDIKLFAKMGLKAYRFSIAWTRILPDGTGKINRPGVDFYKNMIIVLQNRMPLEIKHFYPKEYEVSKKVLAFLNRELSIELPEEEAGNIAFHLVNAQSEQNDMGNTILGIKMQKNIFNIIQVSFQKKLDTDSMNYARLVIHIQFFLQRLFDDKMLEDQGVGVYEHIKEKLPKEISCARQIKRYIENTMQKTISEEEIGYLALHISRVIS